MIPEVISIGGAAYRTSFIRSFKTKEAWVKDRMKTAGCAWPDKMPDVREKLFGEMYDLANPKKKNADLGGNGGEPSGD